MATAYRMMLPYVLSGTRSRFVRSAGLGQASQLTLADRNDWAFNRIPKLLQVVDALKAWRTEVGGPGGVIGQLGQDGTLWLVRMQAIEEGVSSSGAKWIQTVVNWGAQLANMNTSLWTSTPDQLMAFATVQNNADDAVGILGAHGVTLEIPLLTPAPIVTPPVLFPQQQQQQPTQQQQQPTQQQQQPTQQQQQPTQQQQQPTQQQQQPPADGQEILTGVLIGVGVLGAVGLVLWALG